VSECLVLAHLDVFLDQGGIKASAGLGAVPNTGP